MVALLVMAIVVVLLLSVLVAGLLRSHADILRALHRLGAGVGDPASPKGHDWSANHQSTTVAAPLLSAGALPEERDSISAPPIAGVTPNGDAVAVAFTTGEHLTLLAFLSSGCSSCAGLWKSLGDPVAVALPRDIRLVVVTKGPEHEIAREVARRAPAKLEVVMSTAAFEDYEIPGSPFFVLIDGQRGRRIGEGVAHGMPQVIDLVRRAQVDAEAPRPSASQGRAHAVGLDGPARELANDLELIAAGIYPGDPSLYPPTEEQAPPSASNQAGHRIDRPVR